MKRAVLYARFSSTLQSESSIEDQFALCRAFCQREQLVISGEYADRAMSGASVHGRAGLDGLIAAAKRGECDVVVVEALDRLSRDMGDLSSIWKEFQFAGVQLLAVHDGKADQIQIGVRGLVGALYLTDLANKTRRGLAGKLREGMRAGGLPYGYRPISGQPGVHDIFEPEAAVVRRVFREYADGESPRAIAAGLNRDGIRPNRGRAWNASTINGNAKRAAGVLANEIYRGEIVWNKVGKLKNPATGKRVPRINPESEWQRAAAPQLRIVAEDLWRAVQDMRAQRQRGPRTSHRAPKRLLSGLLKCACCGSGIVSAGNDHGRPVARCSRLYESGDCDNKRKIYLDTIERAVIEGLRESLANPAIITEAVKEYHAEMRRLAGARSRDLVADRRQHDELRNKISRLVDAIAEGSVEAAIVGRKLSEMQIEADRLAEKMAEAHDAEIVSLHPRALEQYLAAIEGLAESILAGRDDEALRIIRTLVESIVIYPRAAGEDVRFIIRGRLVALLDPSVGSLVPRGWHTFTHRQDDPIFAIPCVA